MDDKITLISFITIIDIELTKKRHTGVLEGDTHGCFFFLRSLFVHNAKDALVMMYITAVASRHHLD